MEHRKAIAGYLGTTQTWVYKALRPWEANGLPGAVVQVVTGGPMANTKHLEKLKQGAAEWNAWRHEHRDDLAGADDTWADLAGADLAEADLAGAELTGANLTGAILFKADLTKATLSYANLTGANLKHANLFEADVRSAVFNEANLREVKGIRFDDNEIRGARFTSRRSSRAPRRVRDFFRSPFALPEFDDPWSLLRRNYTGTNAVLALLALLAFLVPRMLTTVGLFLLDAYQAVASDVILVTLDQSQARQNELIESIEREYGAGTTYDVWRVALGIHAGGWEAYGWAALIILLLVYNLGRFWITLGVAPLRDAEARSNVTPGLGDYMSLYRWHRLLKPVGVLAVVVALYNVVRFVIWIATAEITLFGR